MLSLLTSWQRWVWMARAITKMADTTKKNPLNAFASNSNGTNSIKLPPFPKLQDHVREHGLHAGHAKFDEKMEELRQTLEKTLNERLAGKPTVDLSQSQT